METAAVESWALRVIERVNSDEPFEDARVELKRTWIDPQRAARRIAGHANASHGDRILWLVGVDEEEGVVGATEQELSEWLARVEACFHEKPPDLLKDLVVPVEETSVYVLVFSTDRAPYVVENPAFGTPDGGPVEREVPWREGTGTRTARRSDLIRILEPISRVPKVEVLDAQLRLRLSEDESSREYFRGQFTARLYLVPAPSSAQLVIPFHKCGVRLRLPEITDTLISAPVTMEPPKKRPVSWRSLRPAFERWPESERPEPDSHTVHATQSEVLLTGPGLVLATSEFNFVAQDADPPHEVRASLIMQPVYASAPATADLRLEFNREAESKPDLFLWRVDWDSLL